MARDHMNPPSRPINEARRLEALRQYTLLDTPPEQAFDDLTALAASIFEAPITLLSFIDGERQWFKSKIGMTGDEIARDISFCSHAILQRDLFMVTDAAQDARFADNPLVTGYPHVRSYAGAPLVSGDGLALGTLCVMDRVPRQFSLLQQEALKALSRQAMAQMELRRQAHEPVKDAGHNNAEDALSEKQRQLQTALELAQMGVWLWDFRSDEIRTIQGNGPVSGLPANSYPRTGSAFFLLVHAEDRVSVAQRVERAKAGKTTRRSFGLSCPMEASAGSRREANVYAILKARRWV